MSYHTNKEGDIVIDEQTFLAAAHLIGHVEASLAYGRAEDMEAIQAYLTRLREAAKELDKHLQLTER